MNSKRLSSLNALLHMMCTSEIVVPLVRTSALLCMHSRASISEDDHARMQTDDSTRLLPQSMCTTPCSKCRTHSLMHLSIYLEQWNDVFQLNQNLDIQAVKLPTSMS